jgi:YhcH/YjgK/YiaL family protein
MIVDKIENAGQYFGLSDSINRALQFLKETPFVQKKDGHYEIESNELFYVIYTYNSKPSEEFKFEVHKKHIDIQYMVSGYEAMGYAPLSTLTTIKKPYDDVMDVALYDTPNSYSEIIFSEGMFILLYPDEGHMFKCQLDGPLMVRRVLVKILVQ